MYGCYLPGSDIFSTKIEVHQTENYFCDKLVFGSNKTPALTKNLT